MLALCIIGFGSLDDLQPGALAARPRRAPGGPGAAAGRRPGLARAHRAAGRRVRAHGGGGACCRGAEEEGLAALEVGDCRVDVGLLHAAGWTV